jgi:hypothetical protein
MAKQPHSIPSVYHLSPPTQQLPHIRLFPLPPTPPFQEKFFSDLNGIFNSSTDELASAVTDVTQTQISNWRAMRDIKNKLPGIPKDPKIILKPISMGAPKKPRDELRRNAHPTYHPMRMFIKRHLLPWRCFIEKKEPIQH